MVKLTEEYRKEIIE